MDQQVRIETVQKLELHAGDVLLVKLGGEIDGETWVPTEEDVEHEADLWADAIPDHVQVLVTHHLMEIEIIQSQIRITRWPPKVVP